MLRKTATALLFLGLAACEFPTEPPRWEQTWVVPGEEVSVSVAELLPTGIFISADSSAFVTTAPAASLQFSLANLCGSTCDPLNGQLAPKPAFSDTFSTTTTLPADLVSAELVGGSFSTSLTHNFNFDPLRPTDDPAGPFGYIVAEIRSAGAVVAYDSIDGADQDFPTGSTLNPSLAIQPVTIDNLLTIEIRISSPDGDPVVIDTSDSLSVSVAPSAVEIGEATVSVGTVTLDSTSTAVDFGVDSASVERIQSGALRFDISNPFTVTGSLDLTFGGITPAIQRTLTLQEGTYEERVDFTGDELRSILGSETVELFTSGSVTATGGTLTITPTQALTLNNEFELVVLIGPTEDN